MTELTDDEKRRMIETRLGQFKLEAFGHELNKQVAIEQGDLAEAEKADEAIAIIATASAVYQTQLDALPAPVVVDEPAPVE